MGHFTQWQHTVCHPRQRDKTSRDIDKIVRYGRKKETPRHRQRQVHKRQPRALQEMHVPPLAPQTQNRPSRTGVVLDQALMWASVDPWRRGPVEEMERKKTEPCPHPRTHRSFDGAITTRKSTLVTYVQAMYALPAANLPPSVTPVTTQISPWPLGMGTFTCETMSSSATV